MKVGMAGRGSRVRVSRDGAEEERETDERQRDKLAQHSLWTGWVLVGQ